MKQESKNLRHFLGIQNVDRCKYGAGVIVAKSLLSLAKKENINIDWGKVQDILTDIDKYRLYDDEYQYISSVINKYLGFDIPIVMNPDYLDYWEKESKKYANYAIMSEEVEIFKDACKTLYTGICCSFKLQQKEPLIRIGGEGMLDMYDENFEKAFGHFRRSTKAFFMYHKFDIKDINIIQYEEKFTYMEFYL